MLHLQHTNANLYDNFQQQAQEKLSWNWFLYKKTTILVTYNHCSLLLKWKQYRALSYFQYSVIILSEFSTLPRKISEYLRDESPLTTNSLNMRGIWKTLIFNVLHLGTISLSCNKHCFIIRYSPLQRLKCSISRPKTGIIRAPNGHNQNVRWLITYYITGYVKRLYGLKWPSTC